MTLEELRTRVEVVEGEAADALRRWFVETFVDTSSVGYRRILETTGTYEDGPGYIGYLWEALARWEHVDEEELVAEMEAATGIWLALWDLNASARIRREEA
jgi:hypothetical protein